VDHYEGAVVEMLKTKQAGMPVSRKLAAPSPQNVVNLMEALRRSITQEQGASAPQKKGRKRQGEMLLPIPGKQGEERIAKPAERPSARQKKAG
jgi:DNA end-binding protein Ku